MQILKAAILLGFIGLLAELSRAAANDCPEAAGQDSRAYRGWGTMQTGLQTGYQRAAKEVGGVLAPVGDAWAASLASHPEIALHAADGGHPNEAGTYLSACVFLAVLTGENPVAASGVPPGLWDAEATALREVARKTVFSP